MAEVREDALFAVVSHGGSSCEILPVDAALPSPATARALHGALSHLAAVGGVAEEDKSFVFVLVGVESEDWPAASVSHAWSLVTGRYRGVLESAGWDVDLIPVPPVVGVPAPGYVARERGGWRDRVAAQRRDVEVSEAGRVGAGPGAAAGASPRVGKVQEAVAAASQEPSGVVVETGPNHRVHLLVPAGHPLREAGRDLPGAAWDGVHEAWVLPITRRTALALRAMLTGHRPVIDAATAGLLRAAADSAPVADVVVAEGPGEGAGRVEIRFEHSPVLQDNVKRICDGQWDGDAGCWWTPVENAHLAVKFADQANLVVDAAVVAAAEARFVPFDYDLTIDGLRGVPVSELSTVRARPARGKQPSLEDRFKAYGIESIYDLLSTVPIRYLDRSATVPIRDLVVGEQVAFLARVTSVGQYDRVKRLIRFQVADGTGDLSITFFNAPWMMYRFRKGDEVVVFGRLDVWSGGGRRSLQMTNPIMDPVGDDTALIVPVYPQSEKSQVTTWDIHSSAMEAVRRLGELGDPFPGEVVERQSLMGRAEAFQQVHRPDTLAAAADARRRLAFDELFRMQLALGMRRAATADETGVVHAPTGVLTGQFVGSLPYSLTGAQERAVGEIVENLRLPHPMNRLLQGDVGAGKSVCALYTLLAGVEGGFQGALMAPTEILATQLFAELADTLGRIEHPDGHLVVVEFLGGKTRVKERRRILAGLADGSVDLVVGTHALLVDEVVFANLGVVVIDEQHRFGVEQRAALRAKGNGGAPDMLVMTATPIPRTAALSVYGDLEISVLDELPPGRTPIATSWLQGEPDLDTDGSPWDKVRAEVADGRQAYVVASLVEDNEKIAAASAEAALEALSAGALAGLRLGLVHGKQPREEREATMLAFKNHELDVLVATTVIEVGVNVPNATVMVVLDATRFGIAQLHQIRGRVGRGKHASVCVLTGKAGSADAVQRMNALVESTDGFYLSEVDLNLRGEGSVFGARQSGQTDLRVASLREDRELLFAARGEADRILATDPKCARRPGLRNEVRAEIGADAEEWLTRS